MQRNLLILYFISMISVGLSQLGRVINGQPVDSLARFPHHVTIRCNLPPASNSTKPRVRTCSGSIIHPKWILTSASCANTTDALNLEIQFGRLYFNSSVGSFSVIVGGDAVSVYPTNSEIDDLALINLPVTLCTTYDLKPISLSKDEYLTSIGIMPGFSKDKLSYGLFQSVSTCNSYYNRNSYDQFYHLCVRGYANGYYAAVEGNEGAGLVVNTAKQSQLIGVLSKVNNGKKGTPSIFVKIQKYFQWIKYITNNQVWIN